MAGHSNLISLWGEIVGTKRKARQSVLRAAAGGRVRPLIHSVLAAALIVIFILWLGQRIGPAGEGRPVPGSLPAADSGVKTGAGVTPATAPDIAQAPNVSGEIAVTLHNHILRSTTSGYAGSGDATGTLEELAEGCQAHNISVIILTDHDMPNDQIPLLRKAVENLIDQCLFIIGVEIETNAGHIVAIEHDHPLQDIPPVGSSIDTVLDWAFERNYTLHIAHPERPGPTGMKMAEIEHVLCRAKERGRRILMPTYSAWQKVDFVPVLLAVHACNDTIAPDLETDAHNPAMVADAPMRLPRHRVVDADGKINKTKVLDALMQAVLEPA